MTLTMADAVRLVVADTWENTDPALSRLDAVAHARSLAPADLSVVTDPELQLAYRMVLSAGTEQLGLALLG